MDLSWEEYKPEADPVRLLHDSRGQVPILPYQSGVILDRAFACGGYVAGGFARMLLRSYKFGTDLVNDTSLYLNLGQIERNWHLSGKGDIDVYFPNLQSIRRFWNLMNQVEIPDAERQLSVTGTGTNIYIKKMYKFQIMTAFVGDEKEMLSSFDLVNSMVSFDGKRFMFEKRWNTLEQNKLVHVHRYVTPNTVKRVAKYIERRGCEGITDETSETMLHYIADESARLKNKEDLDSYIDKSGMIKGMEWRSLAYVSWRLRDQIPTKDLMLMSVILSNDVVGYRQSVIEYIKKRTNFLQDDTIL